MAVVALNLILKVMSVISINEKEARFRMYFDQNYPKVRAFAYQLLKSEEDAEDTAQDIFVKLWERPDIWEQHESMDSYLYAIVKNHIYNFLRRKTLEQDYLEIAAEKMKLEELELPDPNDELTYQDLKILIEMAVEHMPEQRKRIFRMSRVQGLSHQEIADQLGLSVRTVEQHIYKALCDLKKILLFLIFFPF